MAWLQIQIVGRGSDAEALGIVLEQLGATAVTIAPLDGGPDVLFGEPESPSEQVWDDVSVTALFAATASATDIAALLQQRCGDRAGQITSSLLSDQDWSRVWMTHFQPAQFGTKLWIVPAWLTPPDPLATNVLIEPGMAFGTGTHPTTALCLEWLARQADLAGAHVIDYGCGSGILAVAAAKLGAAHVQAVDLDAHALRATAENASRNQVADRIDCLTPSRIAGTSQADLLLANILLTPLCNLAPAFAQQVRPQGHLVLSGLLTEQMEACRDVYKQWFDIFGCEEMEGWGLLTGQRRTDAS